MTELRNKFQSVTILIIFVWLLFLVLLPNLLVLIASFLTRDSVDLIQFKFSFEGYRKLFDPIHLHILWNSFKISSIATLVCLIVGYPFAYIVVRSHIKHRNILLFFIVLPFWTNSLIRLYGVKLFFGTKGLLNNILLSLHIIEHPLRLMNTQAAVIIGIVYLLLPFMILPLYSAIEKMDVSLLEAAKDLGANTYQRFVKVVIPLTMPGIIAGCLLVFLPAMGIFYVADILGGARYLLLGNIIKNAFLVTRDWPFGSAISIILVVLMAVLLFIYYKVTKLLNRKIELHQ